MIKEMPVIGFGTWGVGNGDQDKITEAIGTVLKAGYKHIDTAQVYHNEEELGNAFKANNLNQEEVFISGKVSPANFKYHTRESVIASLKRMNLKWIDLMILHTPMSDEINLIAYKELMMLRDEGIVKHIGVSNFRVSQLEAIHSATGEWPYSNQISLSPVQRPEKLENFCKEKGILLTGYSVMKRYFESDQVYATTTLSDEQKKYIDTLAAKYNKDAGQVLNKWSIQQGYYGIPKSSNPKRIISNIKLNDFELSQEDMNHINNWNRFKDSEWILDQKQWSSSVTEDKLKTGYKLD